MLHMLNEVEYDFEKINTVDWVLNKDYNSLKTKYQLIIIISYMIKLWIVLKEAHKRMANQKKHNNEDNSFVSINKVQLD